MRFTKLIAESFQAIQRIDIEFGPGLNVLYGPNDLGKSTLATAIRAALLVSPSAAEAEQYAPWYADATPRVSLTFIDDAGHFWRITKGFGSGAGTGAELQHSKDGISFVLDCKARQVEEKLRALLAWGIPAPGGKGGPRGLPTSFLANTLLAAQTDVDAILGDSLAGDLDGTGKLRLVKALATLAQDQAFKKVLDAAQREVEVCFAPKGGRKRGQASKFTQAGNVVKQFQEELAALQRQLVDSSATEQTVNILRERRAQATLRASEASASLKVVQARFASTRAREQVQERLASAQLALLEITAHAARASTLASEVETLVAREAARLHDVGIAVAASEAADTALRAAEEAQRIATSEDGARERELRRAQLAEQAAGLTLKRQSVEARRSSADTAVKAGIAVDAARAAILRAREASDKINGELATSRERMKEADAEQEIARALVAYGRWRAASSAVNDVASAKLAATKNRAEADSKEAEAKSLEARVHTLEAEGAARQGVLPTEEEVKALERVGRELEVAEAALGGGISVAVRPRGGIAVRALVDQRDPVTESSLSNEWVLEAERTVVLAIGELVDIEVSAGATDKRRAVESLRTRWKTEVTPVLERARAKSLAEIVSAITVVATQRAAVLELRRGEEKLYAESKSLREQATIHEEQAAKAGARIDDLEARKAAIGPTDVALLEPRFAKLGSAWESQAETLHAAKVGELKTLQTQAALGEQAAKLAEYRVSEAEGRAEELAVAYERALISLESRDPGALLQAMEEELGSISQTEAENAAKQHSLAAEANVEVQKTASAVEVANARILIARDAHGLAVAALDVARAELHARIGQRNELTSQLAAMDRAGAEELVNLRAGELAAFPNEPHVSDEDLAVAERVLATANRELEDTKEELHKSEGALSKVGGAAVREEVERLEEALDGARVRERELEVDADAWKLLLETLRAVENEEGAHLGRALAVPVTSRFIELTGGRYGALRLNAVLKAEGVDAVAVSNGPDVLRALSVGTRDQLATLIRVTIAEQLKTAIVLDDHLVHTDPARLAWFRDVLMKTALSTQVIVLTCRPGDYLSAAELPTGAPMRDLAGGTVRAVDVSRVMKRWAVTPSRPPTVATSERTEGDGSESTPTQ